MFKNGTNSLLAIDLAPEAVRVLDVALRRGGTPAILAMACEMLPEGAPANLPERHISALEKLLAGRHLRGRHCVAAMPTNLVTTRTVLIDPSKPGAPEDQIRQTLQNILNCDPKNLLCDYWKVSEPDPKTKTYEVLVVAAQQAVVHKYLDGFTRLKLACNHLDVAPCALACLISRLMPNQDGILGTVVLGDSLGYFAVVEEQRVLFWRPFEIPACKNGEQAGYERVGHEISKCVSHMIGSRHFDTLGDIVAFGNGVRDQAFSSYLTQRFNLRIHTPSPFEGLPAEVVSADLQQVFENMGDTHFAAALGLALQPSGGRNG